MLDILYIALTLALFAMVSLAAAGVDRLGPRVRIATRQGAILDPTNSSDPDAAPASAHEEARS